MSHNSNFFDVLNKSKPNSMGEAVLIDLQKAIGKKVIDRLSILDPYVVIAGGAPRDWLFGKPASDLDVYLSYHPTVPKHVVQRQIAKALCVPNEKVEVLGVQFDDNVDQTTTYTINPNVSSVYEVVYRGVVIQIVNMHKVNVDVSQFCFSICQAWTKDCQEIITTSDFDYSVKNKVIFKTGDIYLEKGEYINKIKRKFPDYQFFEGRPL